MRRDRCDDVCIGLVITGDAAQAGQAGHGQGMHLHLRPGDAIVIDRLHPVQTTDLRHITLILDRARVHESLGQDPGILAGVRLPSFGLSRLLQSYIRAIVDEADDLPPEHRAIALACAADMALAVLQQEFRRKITQIRLSLGLYEAATAMIDQQCSDPELTPAKVAAMLGCSRAALYRLFAQQAEGVAATIWSARLERAEQMLHSPRYTDLLVCDIAFRSGFVDQPTFHRMFKRRYGMTPRAARGRAKSG